MLNVLGNSLNFFINRIGENDVTEIFRKTEEAGTETEYTYTEQKGITGKPTIVASGIGLQRYSLPIKLHFSYCNPSKIIAGLQEIAKNSEIISYFQDNEYRGEFVIVKIVENPITHYDENLLYAEITVDSLEHPLDPDEEYTQKTNPNKSWIENLIDDKAPKITEPIKTVANSTGSATVSIITETALNLALGQAQSYISSGTGGLL